MSLDPTKEAEILAAAKERMRKKIGDIVSSTKKSAEEKKQEDSAATEQDEISEPVVLTEAKKLVEKVAQPEISESETVDEKEEEKIREWNEKNKKEIEKEVVDFKEDESGSADVKVKRSGANAEVEKEKRETSSPAESLVEFGEKKEKDPLEAALKSARDLYADTDYRDRTATQRVRKFFNMRPEEKYAENENISGAREMYKKALEALKEDRINKLKTSGLSGKELESEMKKLFSMFNHKETLEFYDARTKAKMEYLAEKENKSSLKRAWDKISLRSTELAEWYNKKVPTSVKIGLGIAVFASGGGAFAAGKRMWGAFMMAAGTGMQLDKFAQLKDSYFDKKEGAKLVENMYDKNENGEREIDFDRLNDVLNEKIKDIDKKLEGYVMRSHVNNFAAFMGGSILGSSAFAGILNLVQHGSEAGGMSAGFLGKIFEHKTQAVENVKAFDYSNLQPGGYDGAAVESGTKGLGGIIPEGSMDMQAPHTEAFEKGAAASAAELHKETLTVHKGSSFIGALKHGYLEQHREEFLKMHPEMAKFSNDQIAFRLAKAYGEKYQDGHLPDFVKAEAKMTFDPQTLEMHFLKPTDVGYFAEHVDSIEVSNEPTLSEVSMEEAMQDGLEDAAPEEQLANTMEYNPQHDYQKIETEMRVENAVKGFDAEYKAAADDALMHPADDGPSVEQYEAMGEADRMRKQAATLLGELKAEDVPWQGTQNLPALLERGAGSHQILEFGMNGITENTPNKLGYWRELKGKSMYEVFDEYMKSGQKKHVGLVRVLQQFKNVVGEKAVTPTVSADGKNVETVGNWLARVTRLAMNKETN